MYDAQAQAKIFVSAGKTIDQRTGQGLHVEILEHDSLRWMRFGKTDVQSAMNLAQPWYPVAAYIQSMLAALCLRPLPARVLSLGLGGGSLERFFAEKLPTVQVVSVEPNPVVTALALRYFCLPSTTPVIETTGQDYLENASELQDLIFVDMCDAHGGLPCLAQREFHQTLARNLSATGMMVLNGIGTTQAESLQLLLAIRPTFPHVIFSQQPASQNVVLLCAQQPLPSITEAKQRAKALYSTLDIDFEPLLSGCTALPTPQ